MVKKLLKTAGLFLSFCAFSVQAGNIDHIEPLPITGVQMVQSGNKYVLMSSNGRFIINGVFDTWNNTEIKNISDVKKYAQRIDVKQLKLGTNNQTLKYTYGEGKSNVIVFVDPQCHFCAALIDQMKPLAQQYTFTLLPVGILSKTSQLNVNKLSCLSKAKATKLLMSHHYASTDIAQKGCQPEKQLKTLATAQVLGVRAVPYIIAPNGVTRTGGFTKKEGFGKYLAMNHE